MAGRGSAPGERRGGRQKGTPNKSTAEIKDLAQTYGPAAIKKLAELMMKGTTEDIQRGAANDLLARGYGRPPQQTQLAGHDGGPLDLSLMSDEVLAATLARLGDQEDRAETQH